MNKFIYKICFLIKNKIFPTILKDYFTKKILSLVWIKKWNLIETFFFKKSCYWTRKKKKNWRKGITSNNIQLLSKIYFDCDLDSFLFIIYYNINNCHYNKNTCFNYSL